MLLALALAPVLAAPLPAEAASRPFTYRVEDASYGEIGTYAYTVERDGDTKAVTTDIHLEVTVLGVTLYRQEASRRETWVGGRLVGFHGVTSENGTAAKVDGHADADRFVITSREGQVVGPAAILPVSPLSVGTASTIMFMPDSGRITSVRIQEGQATSLVLDGAAQKVKVYGMDTADGTEHYSVWVNQEGIPLKFAVKDSDNDLTFTLLP